MWELQKLIDSGNVTHCLWLPNLSGIPHICNIQNPNDSADILRVIGKIRI